MKKLVLLFLALCALALTGCGGASRHQSLAGQVVEARLDSAGQPQMLLIQTREGEQVGILPTREARFLGMDGLDAEALLGDGQTEVALSAEIFLPDRTTLTANDGRTLPAYPSDLVQVTGYSLPEPVLLEDGTALRLWHYQDARAYLLPTGEELLRVQKTVSPEQVFTAGGESFSDLPRAVRDRILAFYDARGPLYDEAAQLKAAYGRYLLDPDGYTPAFLSQESSLSASGEGALYFLTLVTCPGENGYLHQLRLGEAFERLTGEPLAAGNLFTCPEEELASRLLALAGIADPALRGEMEQAFEPQNLIFFPDNLEIGFPAGSLPGQENDCLVGLDLDQELRALLQPWAVPSQGQ